MTTKIDIYIEGRKFGLSFRNPIEAAKWLLDNKYQIKSNETKNGKKAKKQTPKKN